MINSLTKERDILTNHYSEVLNFNKKLEIIEKLIDISEKLRDDEKFIEYQKEAKLLKDEIKNRKIKLGYYLKQIKVSLQQSINNLGINPVHEGDFKEVYMKLYSFSSNLKNLAKPQVCEYYQNLSKKILNKNMLSHEELSEIISEIFSMEDNIEVYCSQKEELSTRVDLIKEQNFLQKEYLETNNFIKKLEIAKKLIEISNEFGDNVKFIEYQKRAKSLKDEIKDRKTRLVYYVKKTKESLKKKDFRETYMNLYSFSSKLKNLAKPQMCEYYQNLSKKILNKNMLSPEELSKIKSEIFSMEDNIEVYFQEDFQFKNS